MDQPVHAGPGSVVGRRGSIGCDGRASGTVKVTASVVDGNVLARLATDGPGVCEGLRSRRRLGGSRGFG